MQAPMMPIRPSLRMQLSRFWKRDVPSRLSSQAAKLLLLMMIHAVLATSADAMVLHLLTLPVIHLSSLLSTQWTQTLACHHQTTMISFRSVRGGRRKPENVFNPFSATTTSLQRPLPVKSRKECPNLVPNRSANHTSLPLANPIPSHPVR